MGSENEFNNVANDRIRIPFSVLFYGLDNTGVGLPEMVKARLYTMDINRLTKEIININLYYDRVINRSLDNLANDYNNCSGQINYPILVMDNFNESDFNSFTNNYSSTMSVSLGGQALDWQYKAQESLEGSEAGTSIKKEIQHKRQKLLLEKVLFQ